MPGFTKTHHRLLNFFQRHYIFTYFIIFPGIQLLRGLLMVGGSDFSRVSVHELPLLIEAVPAQGPRTRSAGQRPRAVGFPQNDFKRITRTIFGGQNLDKLTACCTLTTSSNFCDFLLTHVDTCPLCPAMPGPRFAQAGYRNLRVAGRPSDIHEFWAIVTLELLHFSVRQTNMFETTNENNQHIVFIQKRNSWRVLEERLGTGERGVW